MTPPAPPYHLQCGFPWSVTVQISNALDSKYAETVFNKHAITFHIALCHNDNVSRPCAEHKQTVLVVGVTRQFRQASTIHGSLPPTHDAVNPAKGLPHDRQYTLYIDVSQQHSAHQSHHSRRATMCMMTKVFAWWTISTRMTTICVITKLFFLV